MSLLSVCSGFFSEGTAAAALGLPLEPAVVAEKETSYQNFIKAFHAGRAGHIFDSMANFCMPGLICGECRLHNKRVSFASDAAQSQEADCCVGGPACQPFSDQRAAKSKVKPEDHPMFNCT
eukprot:8355549-Pyramimonas_sp.AAC.1